jgi:hypothetical protein
MELATTNATFFFSLGGSPLSALQKEPASKTAPTDPGTDIARVAERRLHDHTYPALRNVSCENRDGTLILHGRVPTYYLKQIAQELIFRMQEIQHIDNRIVVGAPGPG